jgi:ubiquinone biosynthesis protein Coq4
MSIEMGKVLRFFRLGAKYVRGFYLALKLLLNPEDLQTLIKLGDLLTDLPAYASALEQLKQDPKVQTLIETRYSPGIPTLAQLKDYPEESLGKAYYKQLTKYNLSPYVALNTKDKSENIYLRERSREIHDILHTVLDLGITTEEEAQLNAFFMVKGATPFTTIIVVGAFLHFLFKRPSELPKLIQMVRISWDMGSQMKSPFAIRWEEFMTKPMSDAKKELGLL